MNATMILGMATLLLVGAGGDHHSATLTGITGTVTETDTGTPVTNGFVRIYDFSGDFLGLTLIDGSGNYLYGGLAPGNYYAITDGTGLLDELWDDFPCVQGNCTVTSGTPITVAGSPANVDFVLDGGFTIFTDGFESGDTSMWSASIP